MKEVQVNPCGNGKLCECAFDGERIIIFQKGMALGYVNISDIPKQNMKKPMTLDELKNSVGVPVWMQDGGKHLGTKGRWIIPKSFHTFASGYTFCYLVQGEYGFREMSLNTYGKNYCCWKSEPNDVEIMNANIERNEVK